MFKGNNNLAVGLFFSLALAGVVGFSMWLAGTKGSQPMKRYSMLFEKDVSGLSLGGPVYYLGVNVGRVAEVSLVPGPHIKVRVDVDVLEDTPINNGSYASLNAQGITGVSVINIAGEPGEHGPLPVPPGSEYPLIPIRQTGLSALLAEAPKTVEKLNQLLDQLNELMGEKNRAAVALMLQEVESITAELALERKTIAALPGELQATLQAARSTVLDVQDLVQTVQPDLATAITNIKNASANIAALTQRVDTLIAENNAEFEHFIDNGLGQVPELIFDLRATLRDLQKLLRQLQEDPSQLILRAPTDALEVNP